MIFQNIMEEYIMSQKTDSKIQPTTDTTKVDVTSNPNHKEFYFKVVGSGTSGWMSYAKDGKNGEWYSLRPSNTSFLSASTAIEPELNRLAYPHYTKKQESK
jgi:hypothetical protein